MLEDQFVPIIGDEDEMPAVLNLEGGTLRIDISLGVTEPVATGCLCRSLSVRQGAGCPYVTSCEGTWGIVGGRSWESNRCGGGASDVTL